MITSPFMAAVVGCALILVACVLGIGVWALAQSFRRHDETWDPHKTSAEMLMKAKGDPTI